MEYVPALEAAKHSKAMIRKYHVCQRPVWGYRSVSRPLADLYACRQVSGVQPM